MIQIMVALNNGNVKSRNTFRRTKPKRHCNEIDLYTRESRNAYGRNYTKKKDGKAGLISER
jgi:hypothetical protein